jgi:hypothetical protein
VSLTQTVPADDCVHSSTVIGPINAAGPYRSAETRRGTGQDRLHHDQRIALRFNGWPARNPPTRREAHRLEGTTARQVTEL